MDVADEVIPDGNVSVHAVAFKCSLYGASGWARVLSGSWWGKGSPSLLRVAGLTGRPARGGLGHGPPGESQTKLKDESPEPRAVGRALDSRFGAFSSSPGVAGSSAESCAMGETLTQRRRVEEDSPMAIGIVNSCWRGLVAHA